MTNRENFFEFLQSEVDWLKTLSDNDLAHCDNCADVLNLFMHMSGLHCRRVRMGEIAPDGYFERIVAWLEEEAKENERDHE